MKEQLVHAWNGIVDAASDPKVALTAGVALPGATSAAATLDLINGWAGAITGTLAVCTGAVVLAIQVIKLVREWRAYRNEEDAP